MTMRPFQSTISIDDARRIIHDAVRPIERTERVPLVEGRGRVLAAAVRATADVPPFSRAAMDGYAVIARDLEHASPSSPASLTRIERIFTGQVPTRTVTPGTCAEVATGAPMPPGADAVVMVEETKPGAGDAIEFLATAEGGTEHRPPGPGHPRGSNCAGGGYRSHAQQDRRRGGAGPDER